MATETRREVGDLMRSGRAKAYVGIYTHDGRLGSAWSIIREIPVMGESEPRRVPLRHVGRHSPSGFSWGYKGSGPADAALSILSDALGNQRLAWVLHQRFKDGVLAWCAQESGFLLTIEELQRWVQAALDDATLAEYDRIKDMPIRSIF
jgi:hypothetical protein